jgi:hypothetical protein
MFMQQRNGVFYVVRAEILQAREKARAYPIRNIGMICSAKPVLTENFRTAVWRGLEHGSKVIAVVRSRYHETSSEDTVGWRRLRVCCSDL